MYVFRTYREPLEIPIEVNGKGLFRLFEEDFSSKGEFEYVRSLISPYAFRFYGVYVQSMRFA